MSPKTLYDKIWDAHVAHEAEDGTCLLYIDRHLVHAHSAISVCTGPLRRIAHPDRPCKPPPWEGGVVIYHKWRE